MVYHFTAEHWAGLTEPQQAGYVQQLPYELKLIGRVLSGAMSEMLVPIIAAMTGSR